MLKEYDSVWGTGYDDVYLRLKNKKLMYYENESKINPLGIFNFDIFSCNVVKSEEDKTIFRIKICDCETIMTFKAKDNKTATKWIEEIERHINASQGS